ncbi:MAG: hypothetical protein AAF998_02815 [Bacteroidota bacterium]
MKSTKMLLDRNTGIISDKIQVNLIGDRVSFDVFLPCDCEMVTHLIFVCIPGEVSWGAVQGTSWPDSVAGHVSLRWHSPGDIFYQGTVDLEESFETAYTPFGLSHPGGRFQSESEFVISGNRIEPVPVKIHGDLRHLQGYYKDVLNERGMVDEPYTVHYHLYYQRKP